MNTSGMNTPDLVDALKESAVLGQNLAAWPDWPVSRLLLLLTQRAQAFVSTEVVKANSGYANAEEFTVCTPGTDLYPLPDRSVGNTLRMLEFQVGGSGTWLPLDRVDVTDARYYDRGTTTTGVPQTYAVKDGWVELYPSPSAAFTLRMTFFLRPSMIVQAQSTAVAGDGSDGVVRGLISAINVVARTCTTAVVPFDQLAVTPGAIVTGAICDVIHPAGNFNVCVYSVPVTVVGTTITFQGTKDLTKIRNGDFLRVQEQADWPVNFPPEFHRMIADRAAMVVLGPGRMNQNPELPMSVQADMERFRGVIRPQVKNAPVKIPIVPMFARGGGRWPRGWYT